MAKHPSFRADQIDDADLARLVDVLDKQAAMPGVVRLRAWAAQALDVRPGERALDVGSGTGSEVAALRAAGADAVGVEPNPGMRSVSASRHGDHFVDGDAYRLPFDDASFDAVRCERVFQHLSDPARAAPRSTASCAPAAAPSCWTATGRPRSSTRATPPWCRRSCRRCSA
ncbi:methyltransferase domain-containing protein [Actinokineospora soli]|uniref:Methyltransferase domain-containing protein n=1 Tax=Actinokineospora soli TaxID=1048753 RepID=A0ABW2TUZ2_9PSEU